MKSKTAEVSKRGLHRKKALKPKVNRVRREKGDSMPRRKARTTSDPAYKQAFEEAYNEGYDEGFLSGFEDGHQLAYQQPV